MSAKPKRSDVVLQCAHAACECWSAYSKRPVSQKIFYRVLASLESSLPAHFAGRKVVKDDGLCQLELPEPVRGPQFADGDVLLDSGVNFVAVDKKRTLLPPTSELPMVDLDGDKEETGVPVQMFHTEDEPRSCEEACWEPSLAPPDNVPDEVLGVPVFNPKPLSEDYWG